MSKKEKRVTLIRFDQRRIRRLRPLARLVSGLLPWCGPLSLLAGCTAMALARLSLRQLLLELCMTELLVALALALLALVHWAGFLAILFVVLFAVFQVLALFLC